MPSLISQFTLGDLVDSIKVEAKIKGSSDLDSFVINIVNELLLEYCYKNRYFELLQLNVPFTTVAALNLFPLPQDFQHLNLVRYTNLQQSTWTIYKRPESIANPIGTRPRWYQLAGTNLTIIPSSGILDGETLLVDYFKLPDKLSDLNNDVFPIPRLYGPLKQRAIYRALKYNDVKTADSFKGDAQEEEVRSKPSV